MKIPCILVGESEKIMVRIPIFSIKSTGRAFADESSKRIFTFPFDGKAAINRDLPKKINV